MKKLNILYVQKSTCIRAIKQALALQDLANVYLVTSNPPENTYEIKPDMFRKVYRIGSSAFDTAQLTAIINRLIRFDNIDLIHCHNEPDMPTILASKNKHNIPVVHDTHDAVSIIMKDLAVSSQVQSKFENIEKQAGLVSAARICVSQNQLEYLQDKHHLPMSNNLIVPNCLTQKWAAQTSLPKKSKKGEIHIVYVGGLVYHDKSHPYYLVDVAKNISDQQIHLHIYSCNLNF